ncbi:AAA domain-containing protein [Arthrobacter sp. B2a2-09]|nr:AAA domain-containing protein [Arthrobacter sp. B2a2-09]
MRSKDGTWSSKNIAGYRLDGRWIHVRYNDGKEFRFGVERIAILHNPVCIPLDPDSRVIVNDTLWTSTAGLLRFEGPDGRWWRVFYKTAEGELRHRLYPESEIQVVRDAAVDPGAADVLEYWGKLVSFLPEDDALRRPYGNLDFVHSESVLARYLAAEAIDRREPAAPTIFPFSSNLSQHQALQTALTHPVSVIEGPPGTGKTQTILNLIASLITAGKTVGVVSFNNAAVDNVREKLEKEGIGFIAANLGRKEKREEFFDKEQDRNRQIDEHANDPVVQIPSLDHIDELGHRLYELQSTDRRLRQLEQELAAYQLEFRHFTAHLERQELPELKRIPLLQRSSGRILDYLADTELAAAYAGPIHRLTRRITGYFKYGPTKDIDPTDTDVVLRLQSAYYTRKLEELDDEISRAKDRLEKENYEELTESHRRVSAQYLHAYLQQHYSNRPRRTYSPNDYKNQFREFIQDCPVILSTCHSLRTSLPDGFMLDYLIIDEASQVNLLAAGLTLASCRNLVVVGDLNQLPHIADKTAAEAGGPAPAPAYDYGQHNILSSLTHLYDDILPSTMLREHYRCHPAIIGFCNRKFYNDKLIAYTSAVPGDRPLIVVRTVEGNHMRRHRTGGRSNQREIDVISGEVIPAHCAGIPNHQIGVTSPYRVQANKAGDALDAGIEADTVHKFQGRDKEVVIMTTVLDETWRGKTGVSFVDDPHLVNVAVSRAKQRFILVTNNDMLPNSRNLRDLIEYIRYRDPDHKVQDSEIVSMFDLLYREYSDRLRTVADRLQSKTRFKSENIIWTLLGDILCEEQHSDLRVACQVLLRDLLPDLGQLLPEEAAYVKHRASFDFLVYNRITNQSVLAIEVDGFKYHEDDPKQRIRDARKDAICSKYGLAILRLPTTGSGEEHQIRQALKSAQQTEWIYRESGTSRSGA